MIDVKNNIDIVNLIKKHEGGWVDHPNDLGKETYQGITKRYNPNWEGWSKLNMIEGKMVNDIFPDLTDQVNEFYLDRLRASKIDQIQDLKLRALIFDYQVNSSRAIRNVQRVLQVQDTNSLNSESIDAINDYPDAEELHQKIINDRYNYFHLLVERRPQNGVFLNGWLSRLSKFGTPTVSMEESKDVFEIKME